MNQDSESTGNKELAEMTDEEIGAFVDELISRPTDPNYQPPVLSDAAQAELDLAIRQLGELFDNPPNKQS